MSCTATLPTDQPAPSSRRFDLAEQAYAARAQPLRAVGAEHGAEVTETGSRQQRVTGGVRDDVPVGVALAAGRLVGPVETRKPQRTPDDERVHVDADTDPEVGHVDPDSRCARTVSASSRSIGRVTLNASSDPDMTSTRMPARLSEAGVVGERLG